MKRDISVEIVATKILLVRGKKVMLDRDLAQLYGVTTKRLNEQVKRNLKRFPDDFMFHLSLGERDKVVAICDHLKVLKFSYQMPYAFTEQGVAMLSTVLNSERAIQVNIAIMRAFVKLRELLLTHKDLADKISDLERKSAQHDTLFVAVFEAIKQLSQPLIKPSEQQPETPKPRIGFQP